MTTREEREIRQIARDMTERGDDGILDVLEERFPDVAPSVLMEICDSAMVAAWEHEQP